MRSMDATLVINNVTALAKGAKLFDVPAIQTTVVEDRGGHLIHQLQDVFPDQTPIDRTAINTWEDQRVVDAVTATGRKDLVIAGLWTDICLAWPAIHALADGYHVFAVTDASGATTTEAHERGIGRMIQAGVIPTCADTVVFEWQRDWAREETVPGMTERPARRAGRRPPRLLGHGRVRRLLTVPGRGTGRKAAMRIGELATRIGASTRALRYYEKQNLLSSERSPSGQRHYPDSAVDRVWLVR
jgi:nicotinamidase-related amidase